MLLEKQLALVEEDGGVDGGFSILPVGRKGDAGEHGNGSSDVAAASSSTAERQRARKLGFSRKSAGG